MERPSRLERLRYAFDNFMARGTIALIVGLFVVAAVGVLTITVLVAVLGFAGDRASISDLLWNSLMRTLDPGTMGGDSGPFGFLIGMLIVTLFGIFIISALIGIINTGLEGKLAQLQRGRSRVVEDGHTVILGWSQEIYTIVSELVAANANQRRSAIVILADRDKGEMDDEIRSRLGDTGHTSVICRTGQPMDIADLDIARLQTAKAIIILSPENDEPDADVIKTLLAVTNHPDRRPEPYHIVAELHEAANLDVARLVGGDEVQLILSSELIARIVAQTCRQNGLSIVYTELLDFAGDEIYVASIPELVGLTFGESLLAFEDSSPIGLRPETGRPVLDPPMERVIEPGDAIIAISEDDDTVRLRASGESAPIDRSAIRSAADVPIMPERTLVLGWNRRAPIVIRELDGYVAPGSEVVVAADLGDVEAALEDLRARLSNLVVTSRRMDTTSRPALEGLGVSTFDHIIVLCYSDVLDVQRADTRTIVTLLHLRDMEERGSLDLSIVSEMLDLRNRALAEVTHADDFIVSARLVSLLMAQVAENRDLNAVFSELFDQGGSEIYLRPASRYVVPDLELSYATVVEAARRRGEVAIGYRLVGTARPASDRFEGVRINPPKSTRVTFGERDAVIVLAE